MPTYSAVAFQRYRAQEVRNVFYYLTTAELDGAQLQEAADEIRLAWSAGLNDSDQLVNDWNLYGVDFRRIDLPGLPGTVVGFTSGTFTGTAVTAGVANQVGLLVSGAAVTAKPRRARSYLTGWEGQAILDSGLFNADAQAAAALWLAAMDEISVTGDTLLRVAVEFSGVPPIVSDSNRLTVYNVRPNPVIQRRRRLGSGI